MKKTYLVCIILLIGTLLLSADPQDVEQTRINISVTEFGYPIIPNASQLEIQIPISLDFGKNTLTGFEISSWYRAQSPYFIPKEFYEVGSAISYRIKNREKANMYIGVGTAFSQNNESISIPLILPIEYRYNPTGFFGLNISKQTMIYGEGVLSEMALAASCMPLSEKMYFKIGGSANVAYNWVETIFEYSYGLLYGLGYQF